jgi:hypothetical protein
MHTPNHAALWATLTVVAFPIVTLSLSWVGVDPFRSFVAGAAASLLVLIIEAIVRRRWWFSDPSIAQVISHPQTATRLLIVAGVLVLIFQTLVLAGFITNRGMDGNVARMILQRQCADPTEALFIRLCRVAEGPELPNSTDLAAMAIREAAATRFFGNGLVSCAARPKVTQCDGKECHMAALVRCDKWQIGKIARTPVSIASVERPVVALLEVTENGSYRVAAWSDDPTTPGWPAVAGPIAERAPITIGLFESADLQIESFRRIIERLSAH